LGQPGPFGTVGADGELTLVAAGINPAYGFADADDTMLRSAVDAGRKVIMCASRERHLQVNRPGTGQKQAPRIDRTSRDLPPDRSRVS